MNWSGHALGADRAGRNQQPRSNNHYCPDPTRSRQIGKGLIGSIKILPNLVRFPPNLAKISPNLMRSRQIWLRCRQIWWILTEIISKNHWILPNFLVFMVGSIGSGFGGRNLPTILLVLDFESGDLPLATRAVGSNSGR